MSAGTFPYGQALATAALLVTVSPTGPAATQVLDLGSRQTAWQQVGALLRPSGPGVTVQSPQKFVEPPALERLIRLSQSLAVSDLEFNTRFAGLPLDDYRRRMPPAIFDAYVRFIGLVPGDPRLDVVEAADLAED